MSDGDLSVEQTSGIPKSHRWRDRLISKAKELAKAPERAEKNPAVNDENVFDFLRGGDKSSVIGRPQSSNAIPDHGPADARDQTDSATSSAAGGKITTKLPIRKGKGLHVSFTITHPEIIGEGGEEAEVPTREMVVAWRRLGGPSHPQAQDQDQKSRSTNVLGPRNQQSTQTKDVTISRQSSLRTTATGKPIAGWEQRRQSMHQEEGLIQARINRNPSFDTAEAGARVQDAYVETGTQSVRAGRSDSRASELSPTNTGGFDLTFVGGGSAASSTLSAYNEPSAQSSPLTSYLNRQREEPPPHITVQRRDTASSLSSLDSSRPGTFRQSTAPTQPPATSTIRHEAYYGRNTDVQKRDNIVGKGLSRSGTLNEPNILSARYGNQQAVSPLRSADFKPTFSDSTSLLRTSSEFVAPGGYSGSAPPAHTLSDRIVIPKLLRQGTSSLTEKRLDSDAAAPLQSTLSGSPERPAVPINTSANNLFTKKHENTSYNKPPQLPPLEHVSSLYTPLMASPDGLPRQPSSSTLPLIRDQSSRAASQQDIAKPPALQALSSVSDSHQPASSLKLSSLSPLPLQGFQEPRHDYSNDKDEILASNDFYHRVRHLKSGFALAAESTRIIPRQALAQWLRASTWWFLKGQGALENLVREKLQELKACRDGTGNEPLEFHQSCVDLAKAWWIVEEILPEYIRPGDSLNHKDAFDPIDGLNESQLLDAYQVLKSDMQVSALSMGRNNLLPVVSLPTHELDMRIWVDYPSLQPGVLCMTAFLDPRMLTRRTRADHKVFFSMLLSDNDQHFSFGRIFGEAEIISEDGTVEDTRLPCMISIMRAKTDTQVELTVVSQDGQVNLHIQSDKKAGPTWADIQWRIDSHSMRIHLSQDFELAIRFWKHEFKMLWGIYDYNRRVIADLQTKVDERPVLDDIVSDLCYTTTAGSLESFPTRPIKNCRVRLFERQPVISGASGQRRVHGGYRFVVITPPSIKTLSSLVHVFGNHTPILRCYLRGENQTPALLLNLQYSDRKSSLTMSFQDERRRAEFDHILSGTVLASQELASEDMGFEGMTATSTATDQLKSGVDALKLPGVQWHNVKIIRESGSPGFLKSSGLRICSYCNFGTVVDRVNLSPGELCISLDVEESNSVKLWRPAQNNLTICFAENLVPNGAPSALHEMLASVTSFPSFRTYRFGLSQDLHRFQELATGFAVRFDGFATSFAISRRRMINKRIEASRARLQVIQSQGVTQLVAFFGDRSLGRCMNFVLRGTDVYESMFLSGRFMLRLADQKFAMPRNDKGPDSEFACLDMPELPSEHDDIMIGFPTEDARDRFGQALPASVGKASRVTAMRKLAEFGGKH